MNISARQTNIANALFSGLSSVNEIIEFLEKEVRETFSDMTIQRDLTALISYGFVQKIGQARGTSYKLTDKYLLLAELPEKYKDNYFTNEQRPKVGYNFSLLDTLSEISLFDSNEEEFLLSLKQKFNEKKSKVSEVIYKKEIERITIELSWKSSQIEGNTYTLLETESLLKDNIKAEGKTEDETRMILNHKKALEFVMGDLDYWKVLSLSKIEDLHKIIVENLGVTLNLRNSLVRITGSEYLPLDNQYQIKDEIEKLCKVVNSKNSYYEKSLITFAYICYLQPFEDGNKRTSRIITNALLLADDNFPISLRATPINDYKKAILEFYELGSLKSLKKIFIEQAEYSVENYF